jgi:hypothetical protein
VQQKIKIPLIASGIFFNLPMVVHQDKNKAVVSVVINQQHSFLSVKLRNTSLEVKFSLNHYNPARVSKLLLTCRHRFAPNVPVDNPGNIDQNPGAGSALLTC